MILPARFIGGAPYGDVRLNSTSAKIGTGGTSVSNSTTTSVTIPKPPVTECQLISLRLDALIACLSNGGTVTAQVFKRDNSGTPANRTLTATKSIEADVITVADTSYAFAITSTSIVNLTFQASDTCRCDIVAASTIDTQPTIAITAEWAIIKP